MCDQMMHMTGLDLIVGNKDKEGDKASPQP
jgi:hypothetical protein